MKARYILACALGLCLQTSDVLAQRSAAASFAPKSVLQEEKVRSEIDTAVKRATVPFQFLAGVLLLVGAGLAIGRVTQERGEFVDALRLPIVLAALIVTYPTVLSWGRGMGEELGKAVGYSPAKMLDQMDRLRIAYSKTEPDGGIDPAKMEGANKAGWFNFGDDFINKAASIVRGWMVMGAMWIGWGCTFVVGLISRGIVLLIDIGLRLSAIVAPIALASFAFQSLSGIGRGFFSLTVGALLAETFIAIAFIPVSLLVGGLVRALEKAISTPGLGNYVMDGQGSGSSIANSVALNLAYGSAAGILTVVIVALVVLVLGTLAVVLGAFGANRFIQSGGTLFHSAPAAIAGEAFNAAGNAMQEAGRSPALGSKTRLALASGGEALTRVGEVAKSEGDPNALIGSTGGAVEAGRGILRERDQQEHAAETAKETRQHRVVNRTQLAGILRTLRADRRGRGIYRRPPPPPSTETDDEGD